MILPFSIHFLTSLSFAAASPQVNEQKGLYSEILGCHELRLDAQARTRFTEEFNGLVDDIRAGLA